jgi:hypothetical protein
MDSELPKEVSMFANRQLRLTVLVASAVLLAVAIGPQSLQPALASPALQAGVTVPYAGRLDKTTGENVPDGAYDFTFALYDAQEGGALLWSETQPSIAVKDGAFVVSLGSANPLAKETLAQGKAWLAVAVRGPGEESFTDLAPRQLLGADASLSTAGPQAGPTCPHDHVGESWTTSLGLGLSVESTTNNGTGLAGVANTGADGWGVYGASTQGKGVVAASSSGYGVYATNTGGKPSGYFWGGGSGSDNATLRVDNPNLVGLGVATYMTNAGGWHTAFFENKGPGGVLFLANQGDADGVGGGDFITARSSPTGDTQFAVLSNGEVRSDVGFNTPAGDFAEMLPAAVGVEPGDVLVIGPDGTLIRSTEPNQTSVAGVYSTEPGFVGGQPVEGEVVGAIPLAIVGVVPVKASAENGAIRGGDLLVTSSVPGHAMKAGPNPALGAVIGKALGTLEAGAGVIKMLATLQ